MENILAAFVIASKSDNKKMVKNFFSACCSDGAETQSRENKKK